MYILKDAFLSEEESPDELKNELFNKVKIGIVDKDYFSLTNMGFFKERNLRRLRRSQRDGVCKGEYAVLPFARSREFTSRAVKLLWEKSRSLAAEIFKIKYLNCLDSQDEEGYSSLHWAVLNKNFEIVKP